MENKQADDLLGQFLISDLARSHMDRELAENSAFTRLYQPLPTITRAQSFVATPLGPD